MRVRFLPSARWKRITLPVMSSIVLSVVLSVLLTGCSGLAPVYSIGEKTSGNYVVRKGDTLYSIAFRYGLDYKRLAAINGIRSPYTIYVDQALRLAGNNKMPEQDHGPGGPTFATTSRTPRKAITPPGVVVVSDWRWPLPGEIISAFSPGDALNKGINIAGKQGDPVVAAADGIVVYAGGNLRGYGKLVIVKHNDNFLSAYGNNEAMLVREGERVASGKAIARVGTSASNTPMLHFEIRKDGKPENPMMYLPKR